MDPQQQPNNNPQYTAPTTDQGQSSLNEPPKAGKNGLIIGIVVAVVVILGVVAFAMMNSGKDDKSKTSNSSKSDSNSNNAGNSNLQNYDVTDKTSGLKFSVSFYKDAKVEEKKGRTFLTAGQEGSLTSVYLTADKTGEIDCGSAASTTMKLNGQSTKVCYSSDNTQYGGFVTTNGTTVQLNVAGQKAISMEDAKAIMESATFN